MKDPIVEEVRKHRMEHTREFGGDLAAICANLESIQAKAGHRLVRLPPRKPETARDATARNSRTGS